MRSWYTLEASISNMIDVNFTNVDPDKNLVESNELRGRLRCQTATGSIVVAYLMAYDYTLLCQLVLWIAKMNFLVKVNLKTGETIGMRHP